MTPAGSPRVHPPGRTAPRRAPAPSVPAAEVPATAGAAPLSVSGERIDPVLEKFNAGVAALNRGDTEEASLLLREVTASSPGLVEGWNALGLALLRQNRLDEADAVFSKVLSLSPRYAPGLLNAGLLRLAQGRIEEGAAFFSRAADLSHGALAPRVNLAVAQARLGNFGQAEETLLAAGRRFPGNPDVLYHLGTVYDRAGNRAKGTEAYTAFLAASAGSRPLMEDRVRARLRAWGDSP
jgi:Flp pilus assembly protein TadD